MTYLFEIIPKFILIRLFKYCKKTTLFYDKYHDIIFNFRLKFDRARYVKFKNSIIPVVHSCNICLD